MHPIDTTACRKVHVLGQRFRTIFVEYCSIRRRWAASKPNQCTKANFSHRS